MGSARVFHPDRIRNGWCRQHTDPSRRRLTPARFSILLFEDTPLPGHSPKREHLLPNAPPVHEVAAAFWDKDRPLLLDGSMGRQKSNSYVMCRPTLELLSTGGRGQIRDRSGAVLREGPFFTLLGELLNRSKGMTPQTPGRFCGGLAGYIGYEVGRQLEDISPPSRNDHKLPEAWLGLYDQVLAFAPDGTCHWHRANLLGSQSDDVDLPELLSSPIRPNQTTTPAPWAPHEVEGWEGVRSSLGAVEYEAAVRALVSRIHAGVLFQANVTQRLVFQTAGHPLEAYRRLTQRTRAPFSAALRLGNQAILSASPEGFLRARPGPSGTVVTTEPIKGTRPRGRTPSEDASLREALAASQKDRAENLMIVDLLRNDLSRVCRHGSVGVSSLLELRSFETVHHLVSTVQGTLRPEIDTARLLKACFPGGSITGAPKVQAMREIQQIEPVARGPYCGAIGWLGLDGSAELSIAIRTAVMSGGWGSVGAGGGIVAASNPREEYLESLHKAHALVEALSERELPRPGQTSTEKRSS